MLGAMLGALLEHCLEQTSRRSRLKMGRKLSSRAGARLGKIYPLTDETFCIIIQSFKAAYPAQTHARRNLKFDSRALREADKPIAAMHVVWLGQTEPGVVPMLAAMLAWVFLCPPSVIRLKGERRLNPRGADVMPPNWHGFDSVDLRNEQMATENGVSGPTPRTVATPSKSQPVRKSAGQNPNPLEKLWRALQVGARGASRILIRENWLIPAWKGCVGPLKKSPQVGQPNHANGIAVESYAHHRNGADAIVSKSADSIAKSNPCLASGRVQLALAPG